MGTVSQLPVLTFLRPSVLIDRSPRLKLAAFLSVHRVPPASLRDIPSASSQALPAPKPVPNHTGHVLRLNRSTENMTPKENPSVDRTIKEEIARSHCNTPDQSHIKYRRPAQTRVEARVPVACSSTVLEAPDSSSPCHRSCSVPPVSQCRVNVPFRLVEPH